MRQRLKRWSLCPDVRDHRQSDYVYVTRTSANGRGAHTADLRLAGAYSRGHLGDGLPAAGGLHSSSRSALRLVWAPGSGGRRPPFGREASAKLHYRESSCCPEGDHSSRKVALWLHAFQQASCSWKEAPGAGHWVFRSVTGQA